MSCESILKFEHVNKRFGDAIVLGDFSIEIPLIGLTAIVGPSGSGKSVICRLAVGLLRPDSGAVSLLGEPVHRLPERALRPVRRKVPYVVQGSGLLDWLTLAENVALSDEGSARDGRAAHALDRVGLSDFAKKRPQEVSPSTRKRAAIARALVLKPVALLLDEPTTGLDREAADQVDATLQGLCAEGLGVLVISHDHARLKSWATSILELEGGRLVQTQLG